MKKLIAIIALTLSIVSLNAQVQRPAGNPTVNSTGWYNLTAVRDSFKVFILHDSFPARYPSVIWHFDGNFYKSLGNGAPWTLWIPNTPSSGTVTSVGSGFGILGGPITVSGTLKADTTHNNQGLATWSDLTRRIDSASRVGVLSVSGMSNQISATPTTGDVVVSLPNNVIIGGTFSAVGNILTNSSYNVRQNASASTLSTFNLSTNETNLRRWSDGFVGLETGANAGYNWTKNRYADDGSLLGTALSINRATGNLTVGGFVDAANGNLIGSSDTAAMLAPYARIASLPTQYWSLSTTTLTPIVTSYNITTTGNISSRILTSTGEASIHGLTVGLGAGSQQNNSVFGYNSMPLNTTGNFNVAIGDSALYNNISNSRNVAIGHKTLYMSSNSAANVYGSDNVAVGYGVMSTLDGRRHGSNNTGVGSNSLANNTYGFNNTAIGLQSLYRDTSGFENTAIGTQSLQNNLSGNYNTGVGMGSLNAAIVDSFNTSIGYQAGYLVNGGSYNTFLGYGAGSSITTGTGNLSLGYQSAPTFSTGSNQLSIMNGIFGRQLTGTGVTPSDGQIGIMYQYPRFTLDINGTIGTISKDSIPITTGQTWGLVLDTAGTRTGQFKRQLIYLTPFSSTSLTSVSPYTNFSVTGTIAAASISVATNSGYAAWLTTNSNTFTPLVVTNDAENDPARYIALFRSKGSNVSFIDVTGRIAANGLSIGGSATINNNLTVESVSISTNLTATGALVAAAHRTTGGTNAQVVLGDGTLGSYSGANLWQRAGTTLSPTTSGDNVLTTGYVQGSNLYFTGIISGGGIGGVDAKITSVLPNGSLSAAYAASGQSSYGQNLFVGHNGTTGQITTVLAATGTLTTTGNIQGASITATGGVNGTLTTAAQPNVTSIGTLNLLTVTNSINAGTGYYSNGMNITGLHVPASGQGLELGYTGGTGIFNVFDRTGVAFLPLGFQSSAYTFGTGNVRMSAYGAGTATFDASGNITSVSDGRLKFDKGTYSNALSGIMKLKVGHYYKWRKESGMETDSTYFSLFANEVHAVLGEQFAPSQPKDKKGNVYFGLADRALLSLTIQALQEEKKEKDAQIKSLSNRLDKLEKLLRNKK